MDLEKENAGEFSQSTGLSSLDATPRHSKRQKRVQIDEGPQTDKAALVKDEGPDENRPKRPVLDEPVIVLQGREVLFAIGIFFLFAVVVSLMVIYITTLTKLDEHKQKEADCTEKKKTCNYEKTQAEIKLTQEETARRKADNETDRLKKENEEMKQQLRNITEALNLSEEEKKELARTLSRTCRSPGCLRAAVDLLDKVNLSVQPCDDFWSYSCGTWMANAEIPDSRKAWGLDSETERVFMQRIREDLKGPMRGSRESGERKYRTLFEVCKNTPLMEDGLIADNPVAKAIDNWIKCPNPSQRSNCLRKRQEILETLFFDYGIDALFDLKVVEDDDNSTLNYIKIDFGGLGLPSRSHYQNNQNLQNYKIYISETIGSFIESDADRFAGSVVDFEKKIAKFQVDGDNQRRKIEGNSESIVVSIAELQNISTTVDWLQFMRRISSEFNTKSKVAIVSRNYATSISHLFSSIANGDLENYLIWRLVIRFAPFLSTSLKNNQTAFFKSRNKEGTKTSQELKRPKYCEDVVMERFPYALIASTAAQEPNIDNKLSNVREMAYRIQGVLLDTIETADWMDGETATEAKLRLQNMTVEVGFPSFVLNETEVDRYYNTVEISGELSFIENIANTMKHKYEILRLRLSNPNDIFDKAWEENPLQPNVFFSPDDNLIGITFSLLQKPFYDEDRYAFLNYGSLGSLIAHEMISAMFDSDDALPSWWSNETASNFVNRSKCLKEYHETLVRQPDQQVVGNLTFREYVADLGGLFHSYKAYKTWESENGEEPVLPALDLSNDQAFFLGFAQNLCKLRRKEKRKRSAVHRFLPAEEIRVRGTLSMFDTFQEVYKCQEKLIPNMNATVAPQCDRLLW